MAPLLVTSPPLARRATQLLKKFYSNGQVLVWQCGSGPEEGASLTEKVFSINPRVCISFYNDYIFNSREISDLYCLVNIHPALPTLRGRGYDILPILEGHSTFGATLHFVSEEIDGGRIIDVASMPMQRSVPYPVFRRMTQSLSLKMLHRLLHRGHEIGLEKLAEELQQQALSANWQWRGPRLTSRQLSVRLREELLDNPNCPSLEHALKQNLGMKYE